MLGNRYLLLYFYGVPNSTIIHFYKFSKNILFEYFRRNNFAPVTCISLRNYKIFHKYFLKTIENFTYKTKSLLLIIHIIKKKGSKTFDDTNNK